MKIKIAGAGAGKTTSMAESIIHLCSETEEYLKIFCITFTNSAAKCIREKIITHYGYIPENIVISTIHSFLYREFIRPYYYLLSSTYAFLQLIFQKKCNTKIMR